MNFSSQNMNLHVKNAVAYLTFKELEQPNNDIISPQAKNKLNNFFIFLLLLVILITILSIILNFAF